MTINSRAMTLELKVDMAKAVDKVPVNPTAMVPVEVILMALAVNNKAVMTALPAAVKQMTPTVPVSRVVIQAM